MQFCFTKASIKAREGLPLGTPPITQAEVAIRCAHYTKARAKIQDFVKSGESYVSEFEKRGNIKHGIYTFSIDIIIGKRVVLGLNLDYHITIN